MISKTWNISFLFFLVFVFLKKCTRNVGMRQQYKKSHSSFMYLHNFNCPPWSVSRFWPMIFSFVLLSDFLFWVILPDGFCSDRTDKGSIIFLIYSHCFIVWCNHFLNVFERFWWMREICGPDAKWLCWLIWWSSQPAAPSTPHPTNAVCSGEIWMQASLFCLVQIEPKWSFLGKCGHSGVCTKLYCTSTSLFI